MNYLRIIYDALAPGGVWINLGPLLWHWENNNSNDPSVELTLEEVKALARKIGFEVSVSVSRCGVSGAPAPTRVLPSGERLTRARRTSG